MIIHCAYCHFAQSRANQRCAYCGRSLAHPSFALSTVLAGGQNRATSVAQTQASTETVALTSIITRYVGTSPYTPDAHRDPPPPPHVSHPVSAPSSTLLFPPDTQTQAFAFPIMPSGLTGQLSGSTSTPYWETPSTLHQARPARWWLWLLCLLPMLIWLLTHDQPIWADNALAIGRICWAIAGIIMVASLILLPNRQAWRQVLAPGMTALVLVALGLISTAASYPLLFTQAQSAEDHQDYALAVNLYGRANAPEEAVRVRMNQARQFRTRGAYANASTLLGTLRRSAPASMYSAIDNEIATTATVWGEALLTQHDTNGARKQFMIAAQVAPQSTGGKEAANVLASPVAVRGKMTWLGEPVPGLKVALVSTWSYDSTLQLLQTGGVRLTAITGSDGSYTIGGVTPGKRYLLVWEGTYGDVTHIAGGKPTLIITPVSLEDSELGTNSIG